MMTMLMTMVMISYRPCLCNLEGKLGQTTTPVGCDLGISEHSGSSSWD